MTVTTLEQRGTCPHCERDMPIVHGLLIVHGPPQARCPGSRQPVAGAVAPPPQAPLSPLVAELRNLRLHRGLSQTQVAERAGMYPSHISQLENGVREPTLGTLDRWARALDLQLTLAPHAPQPTGKRHRVLVAGSHTWNRWDLVATALNQRLHQHGSLAVLHGGCTTGVDAMANRWALEQIRRGANVTVEVHPAAAAGPRRNAAIRRLGADECLAFLDRCTRPGCWKPQPHGSHNTAGTVALAQQAGIPVKTVKLWEL